MQNKMEIRQFVDCVREGLLHEGETINLENYQIKIISKEDKTW